MCVSKKIVSCVVQGPSMKLEDLAPSLVTYLEAAATNGLQDNGPSHEAFEVLEKALEILTDPYNTVMGYELSKGFLGMLNKLLLKNQKEKKTVTEAMVNAAIANHVSLHLTNGYVMLDKHHSKNLMGDTRAYLPQTFKFAGLALGK